MCFIPNPNFNGMAALSIAPAFTKISDGTVFAFGSQTVAIKFHITSVNDRPVINKGQMQAPPLAYNLSSVSTTGFMVSTLLDQIISTSSDKKVVTDPDRDTIGIIPYDISEAYLESSRTSTIELFCFFLAVNYFLFSQKSFNVDVHLDSKYAFGLQFVHFDISSVNS